MTNLRAMSTMAREISAENPFTSEEKRELTCGILGGLGPEATVHFLANILTTTQRLYDCQEDQDHIHTVVELNPKVPNRNHAIYGTGEDCGPVLERMAGNLAAANADFIVCACNTAHAFEKEMKEGGGEDVPFLSMIEVTADTVLRNMKESSEVRKAGILAGGGCVEAGLY